MRGDFPWRRQSPSILITKLKDDRCLIWFLPCARELVVQCPLRVLGHQA
jgi:hypothetical protein